MVGNSEGSSDKPPGLREVKKARTRQAISDVATELFVEHGFERVTVAQVAAAADVSIKTVFNYFASKEDLFFDRADELVHGLVRTIAQRSPQMTVADALHRLLADNRVPFPGAGWGSLRDPEGYEGFRSFVATEHASPALRARRLVIADSWSEPLARAVAGELGLAEQDPAAMTYAAMLLGIMALRERVLSSGLLERASARVIERRVRAAMDEAFGRLRAAFADLDVGRPSAS
jgi:AcrR family transcriptional regulator